ncbi:hypothetical protein GNX71_01225 [Variovorax sp. RKNM96]|uniref:hypothetical protein n=1 Tax=Variovorax sp. RKNM96 TaxID=2681552 RepID=UPI00197E361B|nr:hypothetical protein [Variovorax sp. RKNM96]QSI28270.1 hypothetical protein GNX71_01225 [Variovorax sp. RKNM96]
MAKLGSGGRKLSQTNANNETVKYAHDARNHKMPEVDANGNERLALLTTSDNSEGAPMASLP